MNISLKYFHTIMPHPHCTSPVCQLEGQWNIMEKTNFNSEKAEVGKRADEYEALATIQTERLVLIS